MTPETASDRGALWADPDINEPLLASAEAREGIRWEWLDPRPVCVSVVLAPDDDGFVVSVPSLPGVASQGDTEEEAREAIIEALAGALEEYGDAVPWTDDVPAPRPGERCVWVWVHREPGDAG